MARLWQGPLLAHSVNQHKQQVFAQGLISQQEISTGKLKTASLPGIALKQEFKNVEKALFPMGQQNAFNQTVALRPWPPHSEMRKITCRDYLWAPTWLVINHGE